MFLLPRDDVIAKVAEPQRLRRDTLSLASGTARGVGWAVPENEPCAVPAVNGRAHMPPPGPRVHVVEVSPKWILL